MFFTVVQFKKMSMSRKEINRLLSKGMWNIYLEVTVEKKWRTQNFDFLSLTSLSPGQLWGAPAQVDIIEFSNFLLQL